MEALARIFSSLRQHFGTHRADDDKLIPICGNRDYFEERKRQEEAELKQRLKSLIRSGSRIEAMRVWRKYYGGSIREAKSAIDLLSR